MLLLALFATSLYAQVPTNDLDTLRKDALNVYIQTSDYVRKEIPYVNYVRDLKDAGVYIISTSQMVGSGGVEYTFFLVGQNENAGMRDTISYFTSPDDTPDQRRIKEVRTLKMGLMRYVAKTPLANYMNISFSKPLTETVTTDKWNSWVYRASITGYTQAQKSVENDYLNVSISSSKVTKDWKINLSARATYNFSKYDLGDRIVKSDQNSNSFSSLIVRSISDHWSYGGRFNLSTSTYSNYNLSVNVMPGIEYDLFPYSESTRRQLRLLYTAGYSLANYTDTTIYNKISEAHLRHAFSAAYEVIQKWGSIQISMEYSNYLHDWSKNNLSLDGYLSLRIAKGLSISLGGDVSLIHDQLGLVKGGATTEQVLLRQKELATQFSYYTQVGLSFTFGSIYNNVVNPRFGN